MADSDSSAKNQYSLRAWNRHIKHLNESLRVMATERADARIQELDSRDIRWAEFIAGARKGWLMIDPWTFAECTFMKFCARDAGADPAACMVVLTEKKRWDDKDSTWGHDISEVTLVRDIESIAKAPEVRGYRPTNSSDPEGMSGYYNFGL